MKLKNQIALIVGGGGGIGREAAIQIAANGAEVCVADLNLKEAKKTCDEIIKVNKDSKCTALEVDVTSASSIKNMVDTVVNKFGAIDILGNFAGVLDVNLVINIEEQEWDHTFNVNSRGTFLVCREVAKQMIKQKRGKIINSASIAAKKAIAYHAHYSASKFAIVGFTQALAIELAPYNVRVNCICPGDVDTDMFKKSQRGIAKQLGITYEENRKNSLSKVLVKRFESPKDVAPLVVFLASEDSDFITGQAINVDGGIQFN